MTDSKEIDDGGPAFAAGAANEHNGWTQEGMSLRDWFAGNEKVPEELSIDYAEALAGREHPHKKTSLGMINPEATIETIMFWAEAQARYRYIMADALIAARRASPLPADNGRAE